MTSEERGKRVHGIVYSCDSREELATRMVALEDLAFDALSVLCGWTMALNEHMGHDKLDATTPPAKAFNELQARARDLEVPNV